MSNRSGIKSALLSLALLVQGAPGARHAAPVESIAAAHADDSILRAPLALAWRRAHDDALRFAPVSASGLAHITLAGGEIAAVQVATGAAAWRERFGGEICAQPAADEAGVFIATRSGGDAKGAAGALRLVGATSGVTRWVKELPRPLVGSLEVTTTHVFAADADDRLLAFDKATGAPSWSAQMTSQITTPIVAGDEMLYVGLGEGAVCAIDRRTGRVSWRRETGRHRPASAGFDGARLYVGTVDGRARALDPATGGVLWDRKLNGTIEFIAPTDAGVIALSRSSVAYALDRRSGARLWKRQLAARSSAPPLVDGAAVAVNLLSTGSCVVLDARTGRTINVVEPNADAIARPALAAGKLLLLTEDDLICYAPGEDAETPAGRERPR